MPSLLPLHNERLKLEQERLRQRHRANHPAVSVNTAESESRSQANPTHTRVDLFSPVVHLNGAGNQQRHFFAHDNQPQSQSLSRSRSTHTRSGAGMQDDDFHREAAQLQQELQDMWEVLSSRP